MRIHVHAQLIIFRLLGRPLSLPAGELLGLFVPNFMPLQHLEQFLHPLAVLNQLLRLTFREIMVHNL